MYIYIYIYKRRKFDTVCYVKAKCNMAKKIDFC